jgi:hypothetical protein
MIDFMQDWCNEHGVVLDRRGEIGFGRPCVGILHRNSYLGYGWTGYDEDPEVRKELYANEIIQEFRRIAPEDAYHKDDYLAVLVHDDDYDKAAEQLYGWIKWIADHGWVPRVLRRKTYNTPGSPGAMLELLLHGTDDAQIRPAEGRWAG